MRTTDLQRSEAEARIRSAMDRLLRGEIPPGGRCDLKTLASQAEVNRTGFYAKQGLPGPYQHLAEEFDRRRQLKAHAGELSDPRDAQICRLKDENAKQKERLRDRDAIIEELTAFRTLAVSRLAAQHEELERLQGIAASQPTERAQAIRRSPILGPC